jgi:hypothetical protein
VQSDSQPSPFSTIAALLASPNRASPLRQRAERRVAGSGLPPAPRAPHAHAALAQRVHGRGHPGPPMGHQEALRPTWTRYVPDVVYPARRGVP